MPICALFYFLSLAVLHGQTASLRPAANTTAGTPSAAPPPAIVIGFVGGFVKHDNLVHAGVQVAARLREDYRSGVHVESFENHRGEKAHAAILQLLDSNHDGVLSPEEKRNARIIIYGISWGASETVNLARELERDGIPVLLTIQVDSVPKFGENDALIPANVGEAINFYQPDGLLHGRPEIRAADANRTQIIGNFRYDYKETPIHCEQYPWYDRVFAKTHTQIECDPKVWSKVESLIRSKLPPPSATASAQLSAQ
jgi:hypothetical protein